MNLRDIKFAVAPMLDWTDRHCRFFLRQISKKTLLYSEMVVADAVIHGNRQNLLGFSEAEHFVALQLGGSCPQKLAQAAVIGEDYGYDEINLNVGCPSNRVQAGCFGASLMLEPLLVGECVAAMANAVKLPITVKCRIGVDEQDRQAALDELAKAVMHAGVQGFWVHARRAWLKGLSPKENREIPPLDYSRVYEFKRDFPDYYIGINGGIASAEAAAEHLQHVDGVMLGRAAYKNPLLLAQLTNEPVNMGQLAENMCAYAAKHLAQGGRLSHITKHMAGLFYGRPMAAHWRRQLARLGSFNAAGALQLQQIFNELEQMDEYHAPF